MRKKLGCLGLILVCSLAAAAPAFGLSYFVYDQWGGTWHDANKNGQDDSLMCWAAAASNILAWGNWGTATYNTAAAIFQHYKDHWTNNVGRVSYGWLWWFNGSPPLYVSGSVIDVPGGGNFYPDYKFLDYFAGASTSFLPEMDRFMHLGYGAAVTIQRSLTTGHALTVWGFDYLTSKKGVTYTGIYVTDSDDGSWGLKYYPLTYKNYTWYLGGRYDGWYISEAFCLKFRAAASGVVVPLPGSLVLTGSALVLLTILGRRYKA